MEIKEFVSNFADQFDEIDTSAFTAQTNFRDNDEWSSLTALSIIAMVDAEYSVKIKGEEIKNSSTIEDIYNVVKGKL